MARRQPDLHTSRNRDHRRPSTQSRIRPSASVSMSLSTRTRRPRPSSIVTSLHFRRGCDRAGASEIEDWVGGATSETVTGTNLFAASTLGSSIWQSSLRHRKSWLTWMPADRAISERTAPGSRQAATNRSWSSQDQRRRRSTDVITSIGCLVIGLLLVFALGLPMFASLSQDGPHRGLTTVSAPSWTGGTARLSATDEGGCENHPLGLAAVLSSKIQTRRVTDSQKPPVIGLSV